MLRRMIIMLALTGLVLGAVFGFEAFKGVMIKKFMATLSNPPQTISTMVAASTEWRSQIEAVGSVRAVNGANLSGQVPGIVSALHFKSGADVKKGDLLLELASADDVAHLAALKATATLAQITYDRDRALVKTSAVSQQTVDTDEGNLKNAQAQVEQQQALVDYKSIKAPFSGRLGIRQVDLGQYHRRRHDDRHAAAARSDLRRLLPAAAVAGEDQGRASGNRQGRHLSRPAIHGKDSGDQPAGRHGEPERPGPGDISSNPTRSCCRACSRPSTSTSAHRRTTSRCRNGDRLQFLRRHRLRGRRTKARTRRAEPQYGRAPDVRQDRRNPRRPGRGH